MKKINLLLIACIVFSSFVTGQNIPKSVDLKETGDHQRRDLSMPMSRIVVNFFDFRSTLSTHDYSTRNTIPVNIAYLTTEKNIPGNKPITRFSRSVTDLLTMYKGKTGDDFLRNDSVLGAAKTFTTEWMPHALPFTAQYTDGASLQGVDFIYDAKTMVRSITFAGNTDNYSFAGNYGGLLKFENGKIIVENNNLRYAISFSVPVSGFKSTKNKWFVSLNNAAGQNKLIIAIAFADKGESQSALIARSEQPIKNNDIGKVLAKNEKYWDDFLKKVPHPVNFELSSVKTYNVQPEQIRQAYYKAWVFTAQNVLPEDAELFPYPQICTGKSSLWDEGEDHAPFSAAWESFIGMQLMAYVDPDMSWKAFKGLMSLVDKDGMLGGESLPSRKAQTALILYELTKDKKSLAEIYPALKRYLDWRMEITHWVYGDIKATNNFKDAEFAFSALVDMQYLMKISEIVGQKADIPVWKKKFDTFGQKSLGWFWETPQTLPVQNYWVDTQKRQDRNTIWITTCLHIKDYLKGDYLTSTIKKFDKDYNPDLSFANFFMPKYPDVSYSVYGLIEHGYPERALGTMEACLRDIARGRAAFAEQYIGPDFRPDGVRPSLFGSSIIIDFVLMKNGFMLGDGNPKGVLLPAKAGGVTDILINGKKYDLRIDQAAQKLSFGEQGKTSTAISYKNKPVDLKTK